MAATPFESHKVGGGDTSPNIVKKQNGNSTGELAYVMCIFLFLVWTWYYNVLDASKTSQWKSSRRTSRKRNGKRSFRSPVTFLVAILLCITLSTLGNQVR